MALNRSIDQMIDAIRRTANVQGTTALQRHPTSDLLDYANRGIAALDRLLKLADTGQRFLSATSIMTASGVELYPLPSDFMMLVSLSGEFGGRMRWLTSYEHNERPALVDTNTGWKGEPLYYRLRQENISLLPTPAGVYTLTLWYAPAPSTLTSGQNYDTIARLDDYIVNYAARLIAKKDANWELYDRLGAELVEMRSEIEAIARNRDLNSPGRIIDVTARDRFGRMRRYTRRFTR
ncbi:MAG: hypothetical protein C4340_03220 [Armatimonadota bacterium]